MTVELVDRYLGCLLGLACGDAVGTAVEFQARGSFASVTDMTGGGPFALSAGQWTDDTSMALCLAESLLTVGAFDARDQMGRYLNWWRWGYLSSTGECFDIGMTVRDALKSYETTGEPFSGSTDPKTAGNGSLMRLAPVVLNYFGNDDLVREFAVESSRTTHAAPEAMECCELFAQIMVNALAGVSKSAVLKVDASRFSQVKVAGIARADYLQKNRSEVFGTGYCVASLEAALWCFHVTDSFEAAVLEATNLGDDADTTAAIVGQIAGAFYGVGAIPAGWLDKLHMRDEITGMAKTLYEQAAGRINS
jgi:ADP-ribosyl-[dinitrogen reductase] hydrolase